MSGPFCKDCKHYIEPLHLYRINYHRAAMCAATETSSLVDDEKTYEFCEDVRAEGSCGIVGAMFEQAPAPAPLPWWRRVFA